MSEPTTDETVTLTTKDGGRLTISSRILLQKTTNNKTIELYHYDAQGKLTGAEADIITWEERNTEIYRWLNDAVPPYDDALLQRRAGGPSGVLTPRARTMPPRDDTQGLVRMASVVHRAPALSWSAATASTTTNATSPTASTGRELTSQIHGRQRSHCEHAVSMKTSVQPSNKPASGLQHRPVFQPSKVVDARHGGALDWSPPSSTSRQRALQPASAAADTGQPLALVVSNGPLKGRTVIAPPTTWRPTAAPGSLARFSSIADRHKRRCVENRRRKEIAYRLGVDY